jgi:uncharacterized membrane protein
MQIDPFRHHKTHSLEEHGKTFGGGGFGAVAEQAARFFGTPTYILTQTCIVITWILLNAFHVVKFDLYPFILLNLAFSLQAAYAAPLILLAQTRQAARDIATAKADADHREEISKLQLERSVEIEKLLESNTDLTKQVHSLSQHIKDLTESLCNPKS